MPTQRRSRVFTISMPPEMAAAAEALAKQENRSMSELLREAFRAYHSQRVGAIFDEIGRYAATRAMIVVIDTNVWISALQFALKRGAPRLAIERAAREHTIATCLQIEAEIVRILTKRFGWTVARVTLAMKAALPFPMRMVVNGNLRVCRDPYDDMVLECAVASGARVLITGDKDLLVPDGYNGMRIVTPGKFLQEDS
jgi:putative PIN family toxin of toxin-antitoxin system